MSLRKLIYAAAALAAVSCSVPADKPMPPQGGNIITRSDPRDRDQCAAQPNLAWCVRAREMGDIQ